METAHLKISVDSASVREAAQALDDLAAAAQRAQEAIERLRRHSGSVVIHTDGGPVCPAGTQTRGR